VGAKDCSGSCAQEVVGIYDAAKLLKPCPSVGANKEEPVEEAGRSPTFQEKSSRGGKFNQESSKCAEECGWAVGSFLKPELCSPGGSELRSESWAAKAVDKCGGMATVNAVKSGRQVVNFLLYGVSNETNMAGGGTADPRLWYLMSKKFKQSKERMGGGGGVRRRTVLGKGKVSAGGGVRGPPVVAKRG